MGLTTRDLLTAILGAPLVAVSLFSSPARDCTVALSLTQTPHSLSDFTESRKSVAAVVERHSGTAYRCAG